MKERGTGKWLKLKWSLGQINNRSYSIPYLHIHLLFGSEKKVERRCFRGAVLQTVMAQPHT